MDLVTLDYLFIPRHRIGEPVSDGFVYFGEPHKDPYIESNRIQMRYIDSNNDTQSLTQPLMLAKGGVSYVDGEAVKILLTENFSMSIRANDNSQYYYTENYEQSLDGEGIPIVLADGVIEVEINNASDYVYYVGRIISKRAGVQL